MERSNRGHLKADLLTKVWTLDADVDVELVCVGGMFKQSIHLEFSSRLLACRLLCQTMLKSELSKQQAACCVFFCLPFTTPPRKPHCCFFLAVRLTSGFISQTSFLYWTWQVYRPCRPFVFALSILCLHSFLSLHLCRDFFFFNPLIAAKYLIFFGSCFYIVNSEKKPSSIYISAKDYMCSAAVSQSALRYGKSRGRAGAQVKQLFRCLCFFCVPVQSHHQLKSCDSRIN